LAVDELFARTNASGATAWYLRDQVGSFDADVTTTMVLDQIVYDPFGNLVTETNATNGDRFKFAGMEYDSVTGLYYDHARYYNSVTGRFMSQDPKGFAAGDTNLYRYVANNPTARIDPSGQEGEWRIATARFFLCVSVALGGALGVLVGAGSSLPTGGIALGPGAYLGGTVGVGATVLFWKWLRPELLPECLQ
jgi:RHS repeat-associated protein